MLFFQDEPVLQLNADEYLVGCKIDGRIVFSIIEYITKTYGKDDDGAYARMTFSKLKSKPKYKELEDYVVSAKLGGKKKYMTPSTCVIGLQVLLGILDDEVGAEYRKFARTTVTRVGAGDKTLKDVIDANFDSPPPNAHLLREAYNVQQRASGGPSIAAPPEQVLERACLLLLHLR